MQVNFLTDYHLEDERVLLRPLKLDDAEHLLPFSLHEPELWKFSLMQAIGKEGLEFYLQKALEARAAEREYPFIVFDKQKQAYAGSTRFYDIQLRPSCLQLGYTWYGKAFQGTGLNAHCKFLLLQFAFEQLGAKRVEFRADALNARSIAAMKGIGCVHEGTLRSHDTKADGTRRDSVILSILENEWNERVKDLLTRKINS